MFAVRAAAFSASVLFANGIYTPFFPIWLASKNLGPDQISAVYALPIVVRILLMPFMVGLADRLPSLGVTGALYAAIAAVLFSVPILFPSFWVILVFVTAALVFWTAVGPFTDAVIVFGVREHGIDYARVRLWGSVGFMIGNLLAAAAAQRFSGDSVMIALVLSYFTAVLLALLAPRVAAPPVAVENFGLRKAFADPILRRALIGATLVLGSHGVFYAFGTLYWQQKGFSGGLIGTLWAFSVAAEITVFGIAKLLLPGWGARRLIVAGGIAALIRWSLFPFATLPAAAFVLQTFHGAPRPDASRRMKAIGAVSLPATPRGCGPSVLHRRDDRRRDPRRGAVLRPLSRLGVLHSRRHYAPGDLACLRPAARASTPEFSLRG
jgi:PPP family 3-phenylpropionic acid transporter